MQKDLLVLTDRLIGAEPGATLTYRLLLPPSIGYRRNSRDTIPIRPVTNQVSHPKNTTVFWSITK